MIALDVSRGAGIAGKGSFGPDLTHLMSRGIANPFAQLRSSVGFDLLHSARVQIGQSIGRQSFHPCRSLLVVTPAVCGLNVVRMVVAPSTAHSFRVLVVGHDNRVTGCERGCRNISVIREFF